MKNTLISKTRFFLLLLLGTGTHPAVWAQSPQTDAPEASGFTLKVESRLVNVPLRVYNTKTHQYVTDLERNDIHLLDNGQEKEIRKLDGTGEPGSFWIVLDASGSMSEDIDRVREGTTALIQSFPKDSEASLIRFDTTSNVLQPLTQDRDRLVQALQGYNAGGGTSIFDTVLSVTEVLIPGKERSDGKNIMILFTDGGDNSSTHKFPDVKESVLRNGVIVFTLYLNRGDGDHDGVYEANLRSLSRDSGGELFTFHDAKQIPEIMESLKERLNSIYNIAYYPHLSETEQKSRMWRSITVQLPRRPDAKYLKVYARSAYCPNSNKYEGCGRDADIKAQSVLSLADAKALNSSYAPPMKSFSGSFTLRPEFAKKDLKSAPLYLASHNGKWVEIAETEATAGKDFCVFGSQSENGSGTNSLDPVTFESSHPGAIDLFSNVSNPADLNWAGKLSLHFTNEAGAHYTLTCFWWKQILTDLLSERMQGAIEYPFHTPGASK